MLEKLVATELGAQRVRSRADRQPRKLDGKML